MGAQMPHNDPSKSPEAQFDRFFGSKGAGQSGFTQFKAEDERAIRAHGDTVRGYQQALAGASDRRAGEAEGIKANLFTNFASLRDQPLDATSNQLISQEIGKRNLGVNTQLNQISQNFRNNPALAKILGSQVQGQNLLANNPLQFQARQMQTNDLMNLYNQGNQANLAQQQSEFNRLGQAQQFQTQGAQAQNDLLTMLSQLGQQFGTQRQQADDKQGLFGKIGGLFG